MATIVQPPAPLPSVPTAPARAALRPGLLAYFALGVLCGVILIKGEIASWYRIQEMLRFQGVHIFGFFACSVTTAAASLWLLRRTGVRTLQGEAIHLAPKQWERGTRYVLGGLVFGLGWGVLNACPGPIYALLGSGVSVMLVALVSVLAGT